VAGKRQLETNTRTLGQIKNLVKLTRADCKLAEEMRPGLNAVVHVSVKKRDILRICPFPFPFFYSTAARYTLTAVKRNVKDAKKEALR
jgi:hypothetical protein